MLTKKQIKEIREHLEKAQNPLFFFDNDQDGLCSFLLLQKYLGRGKGVAVKTFPDLSADYFRKVQELNADYIFILDKPVVSQAFFDEAEKVNIPVVWIDHHDIDKKTIPGFVNYYNPLFNKKKSNEPVTALCYQITKREADLWIAVVGCISDRYVPSFYKKFVKKYPTMAIKSKNAADVFYKSEIGKVTKILGFGLKDSISNVVSMIKFLITARGPEDVLEESPKNYTLIKKFNEVDAKYKKIIEKAVSIGEQSKKLLFFYYGGDLSISSDLSNELSYIFPDKIVCVVYKKGAKANISMRGKKCRDLFVKAIKGFEGARGGGHEMAVGGQINTEDVENFRKKLEKIIIKK